jgi:hypothetical protein
MQRSRSDELLIAEGLRWRKHETWFGERVDPAFAEKRVHIECQPVVAGDDGLSTAGS